MYAIATWDYAVVLLFLGATLLLGLGSGRGVTTLQDYALGHRNYSVGAMAMTLLATNLSGAGLLSMSSMIATDGVIVGLSCFSVCIGFVLAGLFIVPHAVHFSGCMTMGDVMQRCYGDTSGLIAGVVGMMNALLLTGKEFVILALAAKFLLGIEASTPFILLSATGMALYVAYGGMKSVVATDILHFGCATIFIPLLGYLALQQLGGLKSAMLQLPPAKLAIWDHKDLSLYLVLFLSWFTPVGLIDPAIMLRMFLSPDPKKLRSQYVLTGVYDLAFQVVLIFLGLTGFLLYPQFSGGEQLVPHMIHNLLPWWLRGLAMTGVLGMCLSTLDSYLHATGLTLIRDLVGPLARRQGVTIDALRWTRYATVLVAYAAAIIALYAIAHGQGLFDLVLTALEVSSPLLTLPLFSAMMGLKPHKASFYRALVPTVVSFVLCKAFLPADQDHWTLVIGLAVNGLAFFGSHYWHHGGFVTVHRDQTPTA